MNETKCASELKDKRDLEVIGDRLSKLEQSSGEAVFRLEEIVARLTGDCSIGTGQPNAPRPNGMLNDLRFSTEDCENNLAKLHALIDRLSRIA